MFRRKPDLIVPIRDRRQHKRYLTLRNAGFALIAAMVLFLGITIRSEMRGTGPSNYGRLVEREIPKVEQKTLEVVRETPTVDTEQSHADPMLMQPAAREQWLHAQTQTDPTTIDVPHRAAAAVASGQTDVAIVGGPEGVKIVQRERRKPVLSGGFGRN
jgi:hypothetical protein